MKLIMSIVSSGDEREITKAMMMSGYGVTKLSSSGGFIRNRSATLICVCTNERVEGALEIIKKTAKSSKYSLSDADSQLKVFAQADNFSGVVQGGEVLVGGATVFVLNVEDVYKF